MVMVMPPYHGATIRVGESAIQAFFRTVSDAISIPIMIQDAPVAGTPPWTTDSPNAPTTGHHDQIDARLSRRTFAVMPLVLCQEWRSDSFIGSPRN